MTKYTKVRLHLTTTQKKKLIKGGSVNLKYNHIGNGEICHIMDHQCDKLARAMHNQKGCRLQLENDQIEHHCKHGSGLFSWIKQKWDDRNAIAKTLGKSALNTIVDAGTNYARTKTDGGLMSNIGVNAGAALAKHAIGGLGVKSRRGKGFKGGLGFRGGL